MKPLDCLVRSEAPRATVLIRLMVGGVFLSEGVQKFLEPESLGAGRFAKIGIPWPDVSGPFVGVVEIAHEARTDFAMLLGSIFLLIVGAGPWSLDGEIERRKHP